MDVRVVGAAEAAPQQSPAAPTTTGTQTTASATLPGATNHSQSQDVLSPALAKIFSKGQLPHPLTINVSYRVEHNPDIVVTVFTDPVTGQEIAQVPPEVMVQLAQFFDKQSGVTLDRSA
jgi:uncharacterized FlaG/YvyC family protein